MFINYLKVAFRALRQNKSFSGLNILGLSLGIACSLLIFLWVQDERSVDSHHTHKDKLYVLYEREISPDKVDADDDFTFRGSDQRGGDKTGDKTIKAKGGYTGEDFFRMFKPSAAIGRINGKISPSQRYSTICSRTHRYSLSSSSTGRPSMKNIPGCKDGTTQAR